MRISIYPREYIWGTCPCMSARTDTPHQRLHCSVGKDMYSVKKSAPLIPRFPWCRAGNRPESKTKTEILQQVVLIMLNNLRSNQQFNPLGTVKRQLSNSHRVKTERTVGDNILMADVRHTTPVCQGLTSGLHRRCIASHLHVC